MTVTGAFLCCLFAAVVSTVSCRRCYDCVNRNGRNCLNPTVVNCTGGCITQYECCVVQGRTVESIKMSCAPDIVTKSSTICVNDKDQINDTVHTEYCDEDLCNNSTEFKCNPEDVGAPNGKYCESCFRENWKTECSSHDRVACRGDQLDCINFVGEVMRGDNSTAHYCLKGCISSVGCMLKFAALPATILLKEIKFKCCKPSSEARNCAGCP